MMNKDLLNCSTILLGNPQAFDTDFLVIVNVFPYVGKPARGDRVVNGSGEVAGNILGGRKDSVVVTDEEFAARQGNPPAESTPNLEDW